MARILVVDDSRTVRATALAYLRDLGLEVATADDGFQALAAIEAARPDLIFADVLMPRLDGYALCALVKCNRRYARIPVVMLTSKDGRIDRARAQLAGADAHIAKPFRKDEVVAAVRRHGLLATEEVT